MFKNKKTLSVMLGSGLAFALTAGAFIGLPAISANAQQALNQATAPRYSVVNADAAAQGLSDDFMGGRKGGGVDDTYLAQALGTTVEKLQAARTAAFEKALAQAVEQGLITQKQADAIKARGTADGHFHLPPFVFMGSEETKSSIDMEALLAQELGITVEKLQTARQDAQTAALKAAVEAGTLTQAQADAIAARQALKNYIEKDALVAKALDMTVAELQAAREKGETMADLLETAGLTREQFQTALQTAHEAAVAQAVKDGVITQAQADALANEPAFGPGGHGHGHGGGHGPHGPGGGGFFGPGGGFGPDTTNPDSSATPAPSSNTDL